MRSRQPVALPAVMLAAMIVLASAAYAWAPARTGIALAQGSAEPSDRTLEIAPRFVPPPPPAAESTPAADPETTAGKAQEYQDSVHPEPPPASPEKRPYLGVAVQTIYANDRPNGLVAGLEVVSVDRSSPAALAGLRGRTKMTSMGESGATVGSLMPPLDLFMMPLLKKTGSLGQGGDLIVAIDDRRVINDFDLQSQLESLKPGDLIYLTIVRAANDGSHSTLKVPIKLGDATHAAATPDAGENAAQVAPSAPSPAKNQ